VPDCEALFLLVSIPDPHEFILVCLLMRWRAGSELVTALVRKVLDKIHLPSSDKLSAHNFIDQKTVAKSLLFLIILLSCICNRSIKNRN